MKYVLFLKDNIAIAKSRKRSLDNNDLGIYDSYEEIPEEIFNNIELPSEKINGEWVKTDKFPKIEYPTVEEPVTELERLRADVDFILAMNEWS